MSRTIRGQINGSAFGAEDVAGAARQTIIPWDFSSNPTNNKSRDSKLGSGDATHFAAFAKYNPRTHASTIADGVMGGSGNSWWTLEPDNWMLRTHKEGSVWANRWIVDHKNEAKKKECRSTMVIDQEEEQNWAWTSDLMWVVDLGADVEKDLKINNAGFPASLVGGKGNKTRAALAGNIAKNAGYVTDNKNVSQWWHILAPYKLGGKVAEDKDTATTGGSKGTNGGGEKGQTLGQTPTSGGTSPPSSAPVNAPNPATPNPTSSIPPSPPSSAPISPPSPVEIPDAPDWTWAKTLSHEAEKAAAAASSSSGSPNPAPAPQ